MKIKAISATEENFKRYGVYKKVKSSTGLPGDGWEAWMTDDVCLEKAAHFGICYTGSSPFAVVKMVRHIKTEELILCGDRPLVLALADTDPQASGVQAEDVQAFLITPGEIVIIRKGIWYEVCRGAAGETYYYFLSLEGGEDFDNTSIQNGPVDISL